MGKRLALASHLDVSELEVRYRTATNAVERSHYQIVWLLAKGWKTEEVKEVTGYSLRWIRVIAGRYNLEGASGLGDKRHDSVGGEPLLNEVQQAQLLQVIQTTAPDGGLWNGRKVADWMSQLLERPISPQRGWEYFQAMEYRLRIPRPENKQAEPVEQEAWKKKIGDSLNELQKKHPGAKVELWAEDEHRIGLKPIYRRVWVPWWDVPTAQIKWQYQWVWLYGFVNPESGQTYWWLLPVVNSTIFSQVLADFANYFGINQSKPIILVLDGARWHTCQSLKVPEGIYLEFLPAYSPELQPAERLWPLTNEPIVNQSFETIEELEEVLNTRLQILMEQPEFIHGLTCFHWWPRTETCGN